MKEVIQKIITAVSEHTYIDEYDALKLEGKIKDILSTYMKNHGMPAETENRNTVKSHATKGDGQYTALDVAKFIIDTCVHYGHAIGGWRLHLAVYLAQEYYLAAFGRPLFSDDMYTFQSGPIVPKIYDTYAPWGPTKICNVYEEKDYDFPLLKADKDIVGTIAILCANMESCDYDAKRITAEDSAWKTTLKLYGEQTVISKEVIKNRYLIQMNKKEESMERETI